MPTYNVADFTDLQLFELLEISSTPTDNELEARIIQMLQRHMYLRTVSGKQLFQFFKDIYMHFFDTADVVTDDVVEDLEDLERINFEPNSEKSTKQQQIKLNEESPNQIQQSLNEAKNQNYQDSKINDEEKTDQVAFTKELQFAPGKINPLLKETYTRTISIDSQYRDQEYSTSTDFTVTFNETLKDVVKMKLYAVQIPVTWYTISNSYGSNFIYLKPRYVQGGTFNTLGIYGKSNHEYKLEIEAGNYDAPSLINQINDAISNAGINYKDVSFGNTRIEYNPSTVKTTFTFDIQKVYNELSYSVSYATVTQKLLGIRDTSNVALTTIFTEIFTDIDENVPTSVTEDSTFTLVQAESSTSTPSYTIPIVLDGGIKTWPEWISSIHSTVSSHPSLINSSFKVIQDICGNSYVEWNLTPNREIFPPVVGAKWYLKRPGNSDFFQKILKNESTRLGSQSYNAVDIGLTTYVAGEKVVFRPIQDSLGGVYISDEDETNNISIDIPDDNYTAEDLIDQLNLLFTANQFLNGSMLSISPSNRVTSSSYKINKVYTSRDYKVVFYDINSFSRCTNASASYRNATIDTTLGYILGFRAAAEYEFDLSVENMTVTDTAVIVNGTTFNTTLVTLISDSVVNVYLYTYFMILLDDFNQNHLNDGLVTLSRRDYSVTLPSYANRRLTKQCNPVNNTVSDMLNSSSITANNLTQKQVYSVEQILAEQNKKRDYFNHGVFVKDMFALLPVKATTPGTIYVEFGGTLQQQERVYFGPVNIRRLSVKLVNDKGDVVDLNGGNWSFQLVVEQLYQRGEST